MKNLFIPYELAIIAKEKGFDESCCAYYMKADKSLNYSFNASNDEYTDCLAPLYQQIVDWFRQEPIFIQILEQPDTFSNEEPMYCLKQRGSKLLSPMTLNKAIEEALNMIEGVSNLPYIEKE